jgi:hypothetical protein
MARLMAAGSNLDNIIVAWGFVLIAGCIVRALRNHVISWKNFA